MTYDAGCQWREDPSDCTSGSVRPDATKNGLDYLYRTFDDAVQSVLTKYGVHGGGEGFLSEEERADRLAQTGRFVTVDFNATKRGVELLESDVDMKFIMQAFNGDLFTGWGAALKIFYAETDDYLKTAHFELLLFYITYIACLVLCFYWALFRHSLNDALREVPATKHQMQHTNHQTPNTKHQTPNTKRHRPNTKHPKP